MEEKKYYWIKLKTDFFNQDTIDFLMSQKNGSEYVVLYQMLCLKTANTGGRLATEIGEMIVPYDIEKIVRETKYFAADTVIVALELFKKLGLIYEDNGGMLKIAQINSMVGTESASKEAIRKRRYRAKKLEQSAAALPYKKDSTVDNERDNSGDMVQDNEWDKNGTNCPTEYRDKRLEIRDKRIENREEEKEEKKSIDYLAIANAYKETCVSLPAIRSLSEARKKAIRARLNSGYTQEDFITLFRKAQDSDFLRGKNDRNWSADFDWLIKDANMAKVLEGKYDNKKPEHRLPEIPRETDGVMDWMSQYDL